MVGTVGADVTVYENKGLTIKWEAGTEHWTSPITGATNSNGFTALPGGLHTRNVSFPLFSAIGLHGY